MNLRYFSGCSGIEAASLAWTPLGWGPVAFCEIDRFPSAVLAHHYPGVPNLGDMTCVDGKAYRGLVDVLVAGTPCQSYSVAGLRQGLADERGSLTLKFVELADAIEPAVAVVWENVPGVLSSKDNAFGCFLGGLAGSDGALVPAGPGRWSNAGYVLGPRRTVAWRVLDAQYFGLAQRRRRVYVVACPRNGLDPAEILFEFGGMRRDTPPSRETGENIAGTVEASLGRSRGAGTSPGACVEVCQSLTRSLGSGGPDDNKAQAGFYISQYGDVAAALTSGDNTAGTVDIATACRPTHDVATTVSARDPSRGADSDCTSTHVICYSYCTSGAGVWRPEIGPLRARPQDSHENIVTQAAIAFTERGRTNGRTLECQEEHAYCQQNPGGGRPHSLQIMTKQMQVRRLTPVESERLQGIPDDYTRIAWRGRAAEKCPDGHRYKAVGNSMPTKVMRWIGERIERAILRRGGIGMKAAQGVLSPNKKAPLGMRGSGTCRESQSGDNHDQNSCVCQMVSPALYGGGVIWPTTG